MEAPGQILYQKLKFLRIFDYRNIYSHTKAERKVKDDAENIHESREALQNHVFFINASIHFCFFTKTHPHFSEDGRERALCCPRKERRDKARHSHRVWQHRWQTWSEYGTAFENSYQWENDWSLILLFHHSWLNIEPSCAWKLLESHCFSTFCSPQVTSSVLFVDVAVIVSSLFREAALEAS